MPANGKWDLIQRLKFKLPYLLLALNGKQGKLSKKI